MESPDTPGRFTDLRTFKVILTGDLAVSLVCRSYGHDRDIGYTFSGSCGSPAGGCRSRARLVRIWLAAVRRRDMWRVG